MTFHPPSPSPALGALRLVDLGTVTVAELMSDGPKTLYTPAAGEYVDFTYSAGVDVDNSWAIAFEPYSAAVQGFDGGATAHWVSDSDARPPSSYLSVGSPSAYFFPASPVTAHLDSGNIDLGIGYPFSIVQGPVGTWTALHAYALGDAVLDGAGHIQVVTTAGTSDVSLPTFDDAGSTTTDGTATWTDGGLAPTQGSVHVVAMVGVPAALS